MSRAPAARPDADERAGRRFALAGLGVLVVSLVVGVLGALVQTQWAPLLDLDDDTTRGAEEHLSWLVGPAKVLTHLGDPVLMTLGSLVAIVVLLRLGHRRLALYVLACRLGAAVLSSSIKAVTDRTRPVFDDPVSSAHGSSFPSGHSLGAAAFWLSTAIVLMGFVRWRGLLVAAVVIPLVVAATRIVLGVHYLTDVTAGLLLGFGWTAVCTTLFAVWSREEGRPVEPLEEGLRT